MEKLKNLISFGNSKLPGTTAIFNFGPASTCPSALLGLCELGCRCYALKAEKIYPQVLPYRLRQEKYWKNCTVDHFVNEFIQIYKRKKIKPVLFRWNESGDFWNQEDVNKLSNIANCIYIQTGVKSYLYTHRTDLNFSCCINQSGLNIIKSGNNCNLDLTASYKAVNKQAFKSIEIDKYRATYGTLQEIRKQDKIYVCPGSCKKCSLCANIKTGTIYTKIH